MYLHSHDDSQRPAVGTIVHIVESHRLGQPAIYGIGLINVRSGSVENNVIYNNCGDYVVTAHMPKSIRLRRVPTSGHDGPPSTWMCQYR